MNQVPSLGIVSLSDEVRSAIEAVGAKLVFLSPYSPQRAVRKPELVQAVRRPPSACPHVFNPIENLWSKLKSILRSFGARTYKDLDEAIALAYAQISKDNIRNWFATRS